MKHARFDNDEYAIRAEHEQRYMAGGAHAFFDRSGMMPAPYGSQVHVFMPLGDHLGSSAFVLDKDSGEVVERTSHQAYGAVEADYRPDRWLASREEYKFTGKEEDIEVGLTYFGARYYAPHSSEGGLAPTPSRSTGSAPTSTRTPTSAGTSCEMSIDWTLRTRRRTDVRGHRPW